MLPNFFNRDFKIRIANNNKTVKFIKSFIFVKNQRITVQKITWEFKLNV